MAFHENHEIRDLRKLTVLFFQSHGAMMGEVDSRNYRPPSSGVLFDKQKSFVHVGLFENGAPVVQCFMITFQIFPNVHGHLGGPPMCFPP